MATQLPTTYLSFLPLVARPFDDARLLSTGVIDFTKDTDYILDLTSPVQSAQLQRGIQSVFIDASNQQYGSTTIQVAGTGQLIVVQPLTQSYHSILTTNNAFVFTFSNDSSIGQTYGNATLVAFFMNVPVVDRTWSTINASLGQTVTG